MHLFLHVQRLMLQSNKHISFDSATEKVPNQMCDVILFRSLINICLVGGPWAECERVMLADFSAIKFMQMREHLLASRVN